MVDARFPGLEEDFFAQFDALLEPGVTYEPQEKDISLQTTFDGDLVAG